MSLRISSACFFLVAAGCGAKPDDKVANAAPDDRIECAVHGATTFTKNCAVERGEGTLLVLRHENGGFRRINLTSDGAISPADGSDAAAGKLLPDGRFELVIGGDRYRLPPRK